MSKEEFKRFARQHPSLANSVLSGKTTWQKLYELYDIYGESTNIWDNYIDKNQTDSTSIKDIFNTFKSLDMDSVQKGVTNIQKTISLLQDLGLSKKPEQPYEPRQIYRRFED